MWDVTQHSLFIVPLLTCLIAIGIRTLFCKFNLELMKVFMMLQIFLIYVFTLIALLLYISIEDIELFKQKFFLQYIFYVISMVLGAICILISFIFMVYYFFRSLKRQLIKTSILFQIEQKQLAQREEQQLLRA